MPIIIDANRASDFQSPIQALAAEIIKGVSHRKIRITIGGHLTRELSSTPIRRLLIEWGRVGALHRNDDSLVDELTLKIGPLASDDPHVIALVLVSNTRLIYTDDFHLIKDIKNIKVIKPKGKVIRSATALKIARKLLIELGS